MGRPGDGRGGQCGRRSGHGPQSSRHAVFCLVPARPRPRHRHGRRGRRPGRGQSDDRRPGGRRGHRPGPDRRRPRRGSRDAPRRSRAGHGRRPRLVPGRPGRRTDQRPRPKLPEARPAVEVKGARVSTSTSSGTYRGRNHVWMPAIGIDRSVSGYACSNQSYPGNRVYRWGCAGANNVYLFGHAHSVFKPLHDAYVRGR